MTAGDDLLHIWSMDDVVERKYEAIEKGTAQLAGPLTPQSAPTRNSVTYSWRCLTHEHHPRERLVVGAVLWRNSRPERPAGSGHNAPGPGQVKCGWTRGG